MICSLLNPAAASARSYTQKKNIFEMREWNGAIYSLIVCQRCAKRKTF